MSKKKCSKCVETKDITEFYARKSSKDGYHHQCKLCFSIRSKANHKNRVVQTTINTDPNYQKECTQCGVKQPSVCFYAHKGSLDGLQSACKACAIKQMEKSRTNHIQKHANISHLNIDIITKLCAICKIIHPISNFSINRSTVDGLSLQCRQCIAIKDEQTRTNNKIRNTMNPITTGHKVCYGCKQNLNINRYSIRLNLSDGHCNVCKDCERIADHKQRELRSNDSTESITGLMLVELKTLYHNCCAYCDRCPIMLHIDHVLPIALGGLTIRSNLLPACPCCNLSKHKKTPEEWFSKIGRRFEFDGNWLIPVKTIGFVEAV